MDAADLLRDALQGRMDRYLVAVLQILARFGPVLWIVPFLGGRVVPVTVRTVLAAAIGWIVFPLVRSDLASVAQLDAVLVVGLVGKEVLVGLALAFMGSAVFWAAQSAGWIADMVRGANMAEVIAPHSGERSTPVGTLVLQTTIVLFLSMGGHRLFVAALAHSYELLPPARFPAIEGLGPFAVYCTKLAGELVLLAVVLVAPVIAAILLTDLAMGWVNRFAPQMSVFFLLMPFKAALGLAALAAGAGLLLGALPRSLELGLDQLERGMQLLLR